MKLEELLRNLGFSEDQIRQILEGMKENKIFTAGEENLDLRYEKLKGQHDGVTGQLNEANKLIEQLKKGTGDNEALQKKITAYEATVAELQKQLEQEKLDSAIKVALLESGCRDVDYITFKLKEKGELSLDDSGKVKGMEDRLAALKTQFPGQFETEKKNRIDENRLPDANDGGTGDGAPKSLAEALRQQYGEDGNRE